MSMDQMKAIYIAHMGDDLTVVNNARVSFDKESEWEYDDFGPVGLKAADQSLIRFLARGLRTSEWDDIVDDILYGDEDKAVDLIRWYRRLPTHWAPFANGCQVQLHLKAPVAIMRQVFKHKVGTVESEVSRRYVTNEPEVFMPEWRKAAENVKQGSSDEVFEPKPMVFERFYGIGDQAFRVEIDYDRITAILVSYYEHLIKQGVCPEQARFVLPQGTMTEARITNSLYGWANFYNARSDVDHAQREVAYIAEQVKAIVEPLFPVSWKELTT